MTTDLKTETPTKARRTAFPKGRQVDADALEDVRRLLRDKPRDRDLLIEHLHLIQDEFGQLSTAHLTALSKEMKLSQAEVYEVASFYHHFDVIKEGQDGVPETTVRVCDGVVCENHGAQALLTELSARLGDKVRVIPAPCIGACDKAPAVVAGKRQIHHATADRVNAAVEDKELAEEIVESQTLESYRAQGGYVGLSDCTSGERSREEVIQTIEDADLRGMGGAGFPTARKWRFLENTPKPRMLVVNADEGEPGTFKDRQCMEKTPHQVLEGILIAAWAIEAEAVYIYIRDEYPAALEIFRRAVAELEISGLVDADRVHLRRGAGAYICGEEGALLESLEGKRGLPRNRPPYPAQSGLFGRPTLINNIETLFWVSEIVKKGASWYQDQGRPRLYSVSGRVKNPGVVAAAHDVSARQLIDEYCGGMADGHEFRAYLPGGASGGILPADKADLSLDFGALDDYGCLVGSAAVVIFSQEDSVRNAVLNLLRFYADESCGQCTPCRVGCEKMVTILEKPKWDVALIDELSDTMRDASICGLGQAAPNPVQA
ncbi:MAG: NAD(P)H-dependent oxidoreductase subunit E, partial [Proteobacteria bacterium]|nr:NAD(P)H-dependent oxidoreductase subunit E [Pseudomonadota bacterium]